ncbi:hypothetical protein [Pseudobdellovibrio sp. HCB154]|uniref:hypothetical protein n=1 Tax=Pseudobdellovibrio sp. HCB154 TaxID=3386277 RepID=UPI0039170A21
MIKKIAIISLLTAVVTGLATWFFGKPTMAGTAVICHLLLILNLLGIWLIWRVVFEKKSVALGVVVIILKYPLLGYIVIQMSRQSWFDSIGLLIGFLSFVFSIVLVALYKQKTVEAENKAKEIKP